MKLPKYWTEPENYGPFKTYVEEIVEKKIKLRDPILYPEGGGQPSDRGMIVADKKKVEIRDVKQEEKDIWVIVDDSNPLEVGEEIIVFIDEKRRQILRQMHSGQHLFSAILEREFGIQTIRAQMGEDESEIDTNIKVEEKILDRAESIVNDIIRKNVPITSKFLRKEELENLDLRGEIEENERTQIWRLVLIGPDGTIDKNLCGGTHLNSTGEIFLFLVTSIDGKRIKFKCGEPAIKYAEQIGKITRKLKHELSSNPEILMDKIGALKESMRNVKKERDKLAILVLNSSISQYYGNPTILDFNMISKDIFQKWKPTSFPNSLLIYRLKDGFIGILGEENEVSKILPKLKERSFKGGGKKGKYLLNT